jgi:hypothetical protein
MADDQPRPQIEYPYMARVVEPAEEAPAATQPPPVNPFSDSASFDGQGGGPLAPAPRYLWAMAALWLAVQAFANLVAVPVERAIDSPRSPWDLFIACGLGLIGSQMFVLSAALVWSNHPFLPRLGVLWLAAAALYGCWFLGIELAIGRDHWLRDIRMQEARAILASLPAVSLAVQAPQWLMRFYFGWTIIDPGTGASGLPERKMSIRDFLVGTAVAALTVAPMRLAVENPRDITPGFWAGWAIAVAILATVSAFVSLPLLYLILRGRSFLRVLIYVFLGSPAIGGTVIATIAALEPGGGGPDAWVVVVLLLAITSCVAATALPVWLARLAGYRLAIRGEVPAWEA